MQCILLKLQIDTCILNGLSLFERQWRNMIKYGDRIGTKEKNKKAVHKN